MKDANFYKAYKVTVLCLNALLSVALFTAVGLGLWQYAKNTDIAIYIAALSPTGEMVTPLIMLFCIGACGVISFFSVIWGGVSVMTVINGIFDVGAAIFVWYSFNCFFPLLSAVTVATLYLLMQILLIIPQKETADEEETS